MSHHGKIYRGKPKPTLRDRSSFFMWICDCECGWHTQYHAWGAVLGSFMQHRWKVNA